MAKRARTKAEKEHLAAVAALGCIVVEPGHGRCRADAVPHHKTGAGMALKASDFDTMPLCPFHHTDGGYGFAIHAGQEIWEEKYGKQSILIGFTKEILQAQSSNSFYQK